MNARGLRLLLSALVLLSALHAPRPAAAQDTPVVFLHGVQSGPSTWDHTAATLRDVLQIVPYQPELAWDQYYDTQARSLQARLGHLPQNTVVVAHSSGGIVAREWSKHRPLQGLVTLGTPHYGAEIARGSDFILAKTSWFVNNLGTILNALPYSSYAIYGSVVAAQVNAAYGIAGIMHEALWKVGLNMRTAPVFAQMRPDSSYLAHLNHPDTIAQERQRIARRVAIAYDSPHIATAGPAVAANPSWVGYYQWQRDVLIGTLLGWSHMVNGNSFADRSLRSSLYDAALYLHELNGLWCHVTTRDASCQAPSDGVVATSSQFMPGGITIAGNGAAHVRQTHEGEPDIRKALVEHIGLRFRAGGGIPGGALPPVTMRTGDRLFAGQQAISPRGGARLLYQNDGNLVVYTDRGPVWHSATGGTSPGFVSMQGDGNLVIYNASGRAVWASNTSEYSNAYVTLDETGEFRVVSQLGVTVWRGAIE